MKYSAAVKSLTKKEGKKVQISRGNAMEVLSIISDMIFKKSKPIIKGGKLVGVSSAAALMLYKNGRKRAARKARKT